MNRHLLLAVVVILVGLPLTLLSLRDFQSDATAPLDNLNLSVRGALKKLPGVTEVEVHRVLKPTHRLIHLRDAPESNAMAKEQTEILRELIRHHGLKRIHVAGDPNRFAALSTDVEIVPIERPDKPEALAAELLKQGKLTFVILDGKHDLTAAVQKLTGGKGESIRVTTRSYPEKQRGGASLESRL